MSKLTLSVDRAVVSRAKRYAKDHGVSVSRLVEAYLSELASPPVSGMPTTPILRSLRGSLKKADIESYRQHLSAKYRR